MKSPRLRTGARILAALAASTGALALGSLAGSTTANADPAWAPGATPLVAVGSNTIEDLMDAYSGLAPSAGLTVTNFHYYTPLHDPTTYQQVYSWDAVNPSSQVSDCINAKLGFGSMARPNGSGNGQIALSDEIDGAAWSAASIPGCAPTTITGEIDIARSSSPPSSTTEPSCTFGGTNCMAWIDIARDAVSYGYYGPGVATASMDHLTNAQLTSLYSNTATGTLTVGGITYYACLPQLGSGTEKVFLQKLNGGAGVAQATGEAAATAAGCINFEENGANTFQTTAAAIPLPAGDVAITPFSVGSFIGQIDGNSVDRSSTGVADGVNLGVIDGSAGQLPYTGTIAAKNLAPDSSFYDGTYGRELYLIVDNKKLNGSITQVSQSMRRIFGYLGTNWATGGGPQANANSGTGQICQAPWQTTYLADFGFLPPVATSCGAEWLTTVQNATNIGS